MKATRTTTRLRSVVLIALLVALPSLPYPPYLPHPSYPLHPPYPPYVLSAQGDAQRVDERIRALQREAEQLAGQARTLLGDLRTLEVERDLQVEQRRQAETALAAAQNDLAGINERLTSLEQQRVQQLPDLEAQLVDVYKRGRAGYARLLFGAGDVREFARATRAVAALVRINEERVVEHRRTLGALQQERTALDERVRELQASDAEARRAQAAADRAVAQRTTLVAQIDARRDLNAQLSGELQVAYDALRRQAADLSAGRPAEPVTVPFAPFRGALAWPVTGAVTGRFGQPVVRAGTTTVRNGIEVSAAEGTAVAAVHAGTVSFADPFSGFGNLVILDHGGNNFSLYGFLSPASVRRGDRVEAGAEVGRVGLAPAGPPALYFEVRIDGRSVDPVQWLQPR